VVARLQDQDWNERTVKTFLSRLVKKKMLSFKKEGRKYWYSPLVDKAEILSEASTGLLTKMFKGDMKALLATFVDNQQLSRAELDYLEKLLKDKEA